jgi:hypothetical protein
VYGPSSLTMQLLLAFLRDPYSSGSPGTNAVFAPVARLNAKKLMPVPGLTPLAPSRKLAPWVYVKSPALRPSSKPIRARPGWVRYAWLAVVMQPLAWAAGAETAPPTVTAASAARPMSAASIHRLSALGTLGTTCTDTSCG